MAFTKHLKKGHGLRLLLPDGRHIDLQISDIKGPTDVLSSRIINQLKVRINTMAPADVEILILGTDGKPTPESLAEVARRRVVRINRDRAQLKDGQPCNHPGCLSHISHPCEGCGRIGGQS